MPLVLLLLACAVSALPPRGEPEPGSFRALTVSAGAGRALCARATFDRATASAGGLLYALDFGEPGDEAAIRVSEGVLLGRGGYASRAALAARRHGAAALALGRGRFLPGALAVEAAELGPARPVGGSSVRASARARERVLKEGDALCLDPEAGLVVIPPPEEAEARVSASQAARAYDGLGDPGALERWLEAEPGAARAAALMAELVPRALDGGLPLESFDRLRRAARASAGEGRAALERAERRAWARAAALELRDARACAASAADADSRDTLERLERAARDSAARASALAKRLGLPEPGVAAAAKSCAAAADRRRPGLPAARRTLAEAAKAAGADVPESAEIPAEAWRRFAQDNGLLPYIASAVADASLGLRRKSERIRARVLESRLDEGSPAAALALAELPACPCVLLAGGAALPAADRRELLSRAREAWAAGWEPGPLGARLRAGSGAEFDGRLRVERASRPELSGLALSREPGSGRRRVLIEAAPGGLDQLGRAPGADRYALEPASGRVLEARPGTPGGTRRLSPERLRRLARLSRALDAREGGGVELVFSFDGAKLFLHDARPMEAPPPPRPLSDPAAPKPAASQALDVKSVR